ncbi:3381_t:CDS:2, partial [Cetraspora pellucida]
MSTRNAKRRANEKISTNIPKKKGRKSQEVVASSLGDLNDPLSDTVISPSRSTSIKKGHKKKQQETSLPLNDRDNNTQTQDLATILEMESNNQNMSMPNSRDDNQNQDDIISSNRILSSRPISISDSREDSPIRYRSTLALKSRNEIDFLNRTSRTASDSRVNSQFDYVSLNDTLRSRPTSPLRSRNNAMNILRNDNNNATTNSIHHFDTTNKVVPSSFNEMTIYQLCSWLCENPKVLQLANNMHLSMQMQVVEGSQFMSSAFSGLNTMPNQENKTKACRDFLEELKCLFLRVRNPQKSVFEELVLKVFKCELNSAEGIEWLHTAIRHFGDFRNKLVNNVMDLVDDFKEIRSTTGPLQKEEVVAFVDESATAHVLGRWLNATNLVELKAQNSMQHLCKFIQRAFIINYSSRDTEKTKTLDNLTKNVAVPSRN